MPRLNKLGGRDIKVDDYESHHKFSLFQCNSSMENIFKKCLYCFVENMKTNFKLLIAQKASTLKPIKT